MIVVSACLAGCACRYDKKDNRRDWIEQLVREGKAIPLCPEQLGGLPTPRRPAEICGGEGRDVLDGKACVLDDKGRDVTSAFLDGAYQALHIARLAGATEAILKEKSPSCGSRQIYDGTFSQRRRPGMGVTAALFQRHGIHVHSDEPADDQK